MFSFTGFSQGPCSDTLKGIPPSMVLTQDRGNNRMKSGFHQSTNYLNLGIKFKSQLGISPYQTVISLMSPAVQKNVLWNVRDVQIPQGFFLRFIVSIWFSSGVRGLCLQGWESDPDVSDWTLGWVLVRRRCSCSPSLSPYVSILCVFSCSLYVLAHCSLYWRLCVCETVRSSQALKSCRTLRAVKPT